MHKVRRVFLRVSTAGNIIGSVFLSFVLLLMVGEIIGRLVFKQPIPGSFEMVGVAMGVLATIGFAFALGKGVHVRSDWLVDKLAAGGQRGLTILTYLTGFLVTGLLSWRLVIGAGKSLREAEVASGIIQVPVYPTKIVLAFAVILFCVAYLLQFIQSLRRPPG